MPFYKALAIFLACFFSFAFLKIPFLEKEKPEITLQSVQKLIEKKEYKKALKDFKSLPQQTVQDIDYRFLNFFLLTVNERYKDAVKLSTDGFDDYVLSDYLFFYAALALNETKQYEKAVELLKRKEKLFQKSRLFKRQANQIIYAFIELNKLHEASKYLKYWEGKKLGRDGRVEKLFFEGKILERSERKQEAITNYKRIYTYYPLTKSSNEAKKRLKALKAFDFTRDERLKRTKKILRKGYLYSAKEELNSLRANFYKTNDRELLYYIAKLYLKAGKKAKAKKNLKVFVKYAEEKRTQNHRLNALLPQAKYDLLVREWNEGNNKHAIDIRNWLVKYYPKSEWTAKSTWILGKMAENKNDFSSAIRYYEEYLRFDSKDDKTYWRLGWVYYLSKDYEKSAKNFFQSRRYVKDAYLEQQILFWLGMALLRDGKKANAERVFSSLLGKYKNTYYGFLATSQATQKGLTLSPKQYRTKPLNLNGTPQLNKQQKVLIQKINKLNSLGLAQLATKEVAFLDKNSKSKEVGLLYISNLYAESKAYYLSHSILLRALVQRGIYNYDKLPKTFLQTLLPKHYLEQIKSSGERHKVSSYFVLSLIRQESSFNPDAVSSAGAKGLMQLMPDTAKRTFRKQKLYKILPNDAFRHLENPENNIEIGIAHINELAQKMNDSPVEVIASYNAGKNAVASWLRRFDKSDLPVFIERITYPETRNYVKKVATNIFNYEMIYGKQPLEAGVFGSPKTIFEK